MYMYRNTKSVLTTELLDGCLWNLVGMKCSWHCTCIKVFWPDLPKGGSRAGRQKVTGEGLLQESASSDWKATAEKQMYSNDLEACGMKCWYFLFHSEVNFVMRSLFSGERQWPLGPLVYDTFSEKLFRYPIFAFQCSVVVFRSDPSRGGSRAGQK